MPRTKSLYALIALAPLLAPALFAHADGSGDAIVVKPDGPNGAQTAYWLETSLNRVFPNTKPGAAKLELLAARNSRLAFQACLRNERLVPLECDCKVVGADDLKPLVRLVRWVPMPHFTTDTDPKELDGLDSLPGLTPDLLWPTSVVRAGPRETRAFWITLNVPADAKPGVREFTVELSPPDPSPQRNQGTNKIELPVKLEVSQLVLQPRRDFPVTHWWRGEATWDWYKTGMFEDERWWELTKDQMANMLEHGSDVVYVPVFFDRRETFKRPCQLLIVDEPEPGKYVFDWSLVKRFTDMCKQVGFTRFEWSHLWIYWGVENPVRIYKKADGQYVMLWPPDISGFSDTYMNFLKQFLPEFHKFLLAEGILDSSYFHLSDEPGSGQHIINYRKARGILRDLAPWMKVMDALSDIEYGKEGITDIPVPMISSAQAYIEAKIPHWVYYCCAPHGPWLNRFLDTPLAKVRMSGFLFYRLGAKGFLHWGYNYWHKMEQESIGNPFLDASNGAWPIIPYGDPFMVYPGDKGVMDSIRWEVFAESLQDYAILQSAGIKPDDPRLADIKTYADFPKTEQWIRKTLESILREATAAPSAK